MKRWYLTIPLVLIALVALGAVIFGQRKKVERREPKAPQAEVVPRRGEPRLLVRLEHNSTMLTALSRERLFELGSTGIWEIDIKAEEIRPRLASSLIADLEVTPDGKSAILLVENRSPNRIPNHFFSLDLPWGVLRTVVVDLEKSAQKTMHDPPRQGSYRFLDQRIRSARLADGNRLVYVFKGNPLSVAVADISGKNWRKLADLPRMARIVGLHKETAVLLSPDGTLFRVNRGGSQDLAEGVVDAELGRDGLVAARFENGRVTLLNLEGKEQLRSEESVEGFLAQRGDLFLLAGRKVLFQTKEGTTVLTTLPKEPTWFKEYEGTFFRARPAYPEELPRRYRPLALSPDGKRLFIASDEEIYTLNFRSRDHG